MKSKQIIEILKAYEEELSLDRWGFQDHQTKALARFKIFADSSDKVFERSNFQGHFTASGFILSKDMTSVLMTHHRKLNKWLQLGGHADGQIELEQVALRECVEESGLEHLLFLEHPFSKKPCWIFDLDDHEIPQRKDEPYHIHYDVRFLLVARDSENFAVSDESIDLKWIPLDQVYLYNNEPSISRCITKIETIVKTYDRR